MLFCRICKTDLPFRDFSPYQQKNKYSRCKKCVNRLSNEWARNNPEKANAKSARHRAKVGLPTYNARMRAFQKKNYPKIKAKVFDHYGWQCACCGEACRTFLQIDHIHNNGAQHRKELGMSAGTSFYYWLINNNFPDSYQTLCVNCNWGKLQNNGICPHKDLMKHPDQDHADEVHEIHHPVGHGLLDTRRDLHNRSPHAMNTPVVGSQTPTMDPTQSY